MMYVRVTVIKNTKKKNRIKCKVRFQDMIYNIILQHTILI
jgi:hypothetical protein